MIAALGREGLTRFSHSQLVESSRHLGLHGVSRLGKDALAARLWDALEQSGALTKPAFEEVGRTVLDRPVKVVTHKFEVGRHTESLLREPRDIPWSYEVDRVTAMTVDPERLFVYWEVTEKSIAEARKKLGPAGESAWLNLRVYDTTDRIFDGTNAHGYFDHRVERHDRQWFFAVNKPTSEHLIEVGLMSHEGYFVKIARSARLQFPRREPAGWHEPEWLTVRTSTGPVEHAGRGTPSWGAGAGTHGAGGANGANGVGRGAAAGPWGGGIDGRHGFDPAQLWQMRLSPWEEVVRTGDGQVVERMTWEEFFSSGQYEGTESFSWEGPMMVSSWESGPFSYPVEVPPPSREEFEGEVQVFRLGGQTRVVHGPWQVVIRGLGARAGRAVIARWEMHRSWTVEEGVERKGEMVRGTARPGGSSELMAMGSSERRWKSGSEVRLGGASELWFVGASELRMKGASERMYGGGSEYVARGASERMYAGSSEYRFGGGTEQVFRGSSENLWRGASERLLGGSSERMLGGASEHRFAGSSERLGAERAGPVGAAPTEPPQRDGNEPSPYPKVPSPSNG